MVKYLNELNLSQLTIYEHFKREALQDGENFKEVLMELDEGYVPDDVYNTYKSLNSIERIEVVYFFTKYLLSKNNKEYAGKFDILNFIIDHESLDFVGYVFKGEEIFLEETGSEQSLFRMHVDKQTGEVSVYLTYSQDFFDVMEEVTHYFDLEKLQSDIQEYMDNKEIDNQGEAYVRYSHLIDEGYECDKAIMMVVTER